jgi:hypothetical protein
MAIGRGFAMRRWIGNSVASAAGLVVGLGTMWVSKMYLRDPEGWLDWTVLVLTGITAGVLAFFVTWGHFQEEPKPAGGAATGNESGAVGGGE